LQQQLLESEASFRGIFKQAAVGVAHVSLDGHFKRANHRYADILAEKRVRSE
jgi:PAS domain-containing protein